MIIDPIPGNSSLFSLTDVFPEDISNQLMQLDWRSVKVASIDDLLGDANRYNLALPTELFNALNDHLRINTLPQIESTLNIKFDTSNHTYLVCWLNDAGYLSGTHIDGTLPATMQVYWQPTDRSDCGTYFYNSRCENDVLHYFKNTPNTGYLALAKTSKLPLWHGTKKPLEEGVLRVCFMIILPDYTVL